MENKEIVKKENQDLHKKYPYIDKFVKNLNELELNKYALNKDDLKTWLAFFGMYINVCNNLELQNQELSEENIVRVMKQQFEQDNLYSYIKYINKLDSKDVLFLKN